MHGAMLGQILCAERLERKPTFWSTNSRQCAEQCPAQYSIILGEAGWKSDLLEYEFAAEENVHL